MAFSYYSPLTVAGGQVPSTQTDFSKLTLQTDARLKTVANGGHVQNASGFDIRPYSDSSLTTPLTYELERYNASTGEVIMWAKVPSLANGYVTYLAYGDSGISTDGSNAATWSNNFGRIYHLKDGSTLSLVDSTGTSNLTNGGGVTAAAGKIDGCGSFASASSQHLGGDDYHPTALTYSIWANATSFPGAYNDPLGTINGAGSRFHLISVKSTGKMRWAISATTSLDADGTGVATLSTATWYYLVLTYDSTSGLVAYVNASVDKTIAANGTAQNLSTGFDVGALSLFSTQYWNGLLDEVHLASVARSADWITTEYNNQLAPGTFETLGAEVAVGGGASTGNFLMFMPH